MRTRIRSYGDKAANFHTGKILEGCSNYICWSVILIDSVLKKDENNYPQVFLKEFKHIGYITDDLKLSSDDSDESNEDKIKTKHHNGSLFLRIIKSICAKKIFKAKNIGHFSLKRESRI